MAKIDLLSTELPQPSIRVAVAYCDPEERAKLKTYAKADMMEALVASGVEIRTEEFLTYFLFHRRRLFKEGYRNYTELRQQVGRALVMLADDIEFDGSSISVADDAGRPPRYVAEYIGESVGLSIVNRIHGITEADWTKIPGHGGRGALKRLDYEQASDGEQIIQMEAKGNVLLDETKLEGTVRQRRNEIHLKKESLSKADENSHSRHVRYGTVTLIGGHGHSPVRCFLADPDSIGVFPSPSKLRLLSRMRFLRDWISFVSPRSQLAAALATRVVDLEYLPDPSVLDGAPLLRSDERGFDAELEPFAQHSPFFATKANVVDGSAGGIVMRLQGGELFLLGFQLDLLALAVKQDHASIIAYRAPGGSAEKTVSLALLKRKLIDFDLTNLVEQNEPDSQGYHHVELNARLFYPAEGLVFGLLRRPR